MNDEERPLFGQYHVDRYRETDGEETHSFVFNNAGQEIPIDGDLAPGDSAELTVDVTGGYYEYYCPIDGHQDMGMQGQLEVE